MSQVLRPIGHEDRLSIVDHLDELRSRLIVCVIALAIAFAACFWQNHALLRVLNRALPHTSTVSSQHGLAALPTQSVNERNCLLALSRGLGSLSASPRVSASDRQHYAQAVPNKKICEAETGEEKERTEDNEERDLFTEDVKEAAN